MPADVLATATVQQQGFPLGTTQGPIRFTAAGPVTVVDDETDLDAFFAALPDGTYTFTAVRRNGTNSANVGTTVTQAGVVIPFTPPDPPDTIDPVVNILAPLDGALVSGLVTIAFTATDNVGLAGLPSVLINLTELEGVEWDTTLVPDGEFTITVRALDAAGNLGEDQVTVTTFNTPVESEDELMAACVGVS